MRRELGHIASDIRQQNRLIGEYKVTGPGRPKVRFHTPGKRLRGDSWSLFWRGRQGAQFEMSIGPLPEADAEMCRLEVALALRTGEWPEWALGRKAVQKILSAEAPSSDDDLLASYQAALAADVSRQWARTSMAMLRELRGHAGKSLSQITKADAEAFLAYVVRTPGPFLKGRGARTRSTRNRMRLVAGRFYRWAIRTGYLRINPFAGVRILGEEDRAEIVHLTVAERDAVLEAARGDPEELAVWIALYAGLRRGEVARCAWSDISLSRRKLDVPRTKTRRRRTVDLAAILAARLGKMPEKKRRGRVVPWPEDRGAWAYRSELLLKRLREKLKGDGKTPIVAPEKIRWNVFRHTFASLLVQAGVSIFKVATWMGNDIAICQRHYAAMMPDADPDIDRML